MNTSSIVPLDSGRTRLVYDFYFADRSAAAEAAIERTIETNCQIVREDFGICEIAQRNLESGAYDRGPLSPRQEAGVRHFHDMLRESLGVGH
jgi:choline monooxygenase